MTAMRNAIDVLGNWWRPGFIGRWSVGRRVGATRPERSRIGLHRNTPRDGIGQLCFGNFADAMCLRPHDRDPSRVFGLHP
jgi:hypothetical protein